MEALVVLPVVIVGMVRFVSSDLVVLLPAVFAGIVRVQLSVLVAVLPAAVAEMVRILLLVLVVVLPAVVAHIGYVVCFGCFLSLLSEAVVVLVTVPSILLAGNCGNHFVVCSDCMGTHLLLIPVHKQVRCSNARRRDRNVMSEYIQT